MPSGSLLMLSGIFQNTQKQEAIAHLFTGILGIYKICILYAFFLIYERGDALIC